MPDFDIDAALSNPNPLVGAPVYMREGRTGYEVYVRYNRFYHYIGSLEWVSRTLGIYDCQSPFEVYSRHLSMRESIEHLLTLAGEFLQERPDQIGRAHV